MAQTWFEVSWLEAAYGIPVVVVLALLALVLANRARMRHQRTLGRSGGTAIAGLARFVAWLALLCAAAAVVVVLAAGAFYYAYSTGVLRELLQPGRYGTMMVTVRVASGAQSARDLSVAADLFRDDGKEIPRVEGARFTFRLDPRQTTQETAVYVSRPVYVAAGQQRPQRRAAELPPVLVIFCFLGGGVIFGVPGAILAVPAALGLKVLLGALYRAQEER